MCDFKLHATKSHISLVHDMKQAKLLNPAEFKRLTAVIDSKRHSVRNHAVVALSFYAGLRACEIAGLRVGDVYEANGTVRDSFYLRAEQTKGSDGNTVLVNKRLAAVLRRYAAANPRHCAKPDAALIFSGKGGGFSAQTIVNLLPRFTQQQASLVPAVTAAGGSLSRAWQTRALTPALSRSWFATVI